MRILLIAAICLLVGFLVGSFVPKNVNNQKDIKVPTGASIELQHSIEKSGPPGLDARKSGVPLTDDQWRARISKSNEQNLVPLDQIENTYNVIISKDSLSGVPIYRVKSKARNSESDSIFIHLHGGGYIFYEGDGSVPEAAIIAAYTGLNVVSIDYRMPPDHPHPAAIQDVEAVYRALLKDTPSSKIGIGGTSAGGGLALAAIHQFKSQNLAVPGAIFAGTPWADLTDSSDTLSTLEGIDRILVSYYGPDALQGAANLYADGTPLTDPLLSPVYGDFAGFPPTYLVSGTRDLFLSDTIRTHRKLKESGVITDLNIYEGLSHADYLLVQNTPEFDSVYSGLAEFLNQHLSAEN